MKRLLAGFSLLLIFACSAQTELTSASDTVVKEALASGRPVVIDLGARHCIPCKEMAPILESLANEYRGRAVVLFIDVNEDQAAALKFNVQMIPTQIFFDARGKEVKRHVGFMDKGEILNELKGLGLK